MLIDIRKRAATFGWIIIGPLILMFALWGISNYLDNPSEEVVASGGDVEITLGEYRQRLENETRNLQQQYGAQADLILGQPNFKTNLVRSMLIERLFDERVRALGLDASDEQVRDAVLTDERFQRDGRFDRERYQQALSRFGTSPELYENQVLRKRIAQQQLIGGIVDSGAVADAQLAGLWANYGELRELQYVALDADRFADEVTVSDDELQDVWQRNEQRFEVPQQVRVSYVELSRDALADQQIVDDAEIAEYYEKNRSGFVEGPATRKVSHILLTVDGERDEAATLTLANELITRLNAGESFADLAGEYSADTVSAEDGGSLGEVGRGDTVEPFELALWALRDAGQLSEPVKSDFGYHIIRLDEGVEVVERSLDEVRDRIAETLSLQKAEQQYAGLLEEMANVAYEQSDAIEPVADLIGRDAKVSEWFSREEGPGIAANANVRAAAFSEEVKDRGYNSEVLELDENHALVLRLESVEEAHVQPLELVEDEVRQLAVAEKSAAIAKERGAAALEQLESGQRTLEAIADEYGLDINEARWTSQSPAIGSDAQLREAAFAVDAGAGLPAAFGVAVDDGSYLIAQLDAIQQPSIPAEDADDALLTGEYAQLQSLYGDYLGASLLDSFGRAIEEEANITIKEESL